MKYDTEPGLGEIPCDSCGRPWNRTAIFSGDLRYVEEDGQMLCAHPCLGYQQDISHLDAN